MRLWSLLFVVLAVGASPVVAHADDKSTTFFAEGQRLMKAGKYKEACVQFEKALALHSGAGTQFNLADCYEKSARPASALQLFRHVESVTREVGQAERSAAAKARADALEPRVPTITVRAPWLSAVPQATLTLDGKSLAAAEIDKPHKVDLGSHEATARVGEKETRVEVVVEKEGDAKELALGAPITPATTTATAAPKGDTHAQPMDPAAAPKPVASAQRAVGIAIGGVGIAAIGVGGFLALGARSSHANAKAQCIDRGCPADAVAEANDARDQANIAGIVMGAGALALAGGVVVYLLAPRAVKSGQLHFGPGGVGGRF